MTRIFATIVALITSPLLFADNKGELIFEDDFERSESQELKDEPGNGWGTNSKSRANGNKQVDLKDGTMRIYIHETADHGVSVTHPAEFKDGSVEMKFMLEDKTDSLGLNFADLKYKEVHAGHITAARISIKDVKIQDLKLGSMAMATHAAKKAKTLTDEQRKAIQSREKKFNHKLETGKWYQLEVRIIGETMTVSIDGKEVGSFSSEGIDHPTKRMLRLAVPKNAVVDDIKIYRKS